MPYFIERANDWNEYREVWKFLMGHYYWFKEKPLFEWNPDEELKEMEASFSREDFVYLVVRRSENNEIIGFLGMDLSRKEAIVRRWEPAVLSSEDADSIGKLLLETAIAYAQKLGKQGIRTRLKFPVNSDLADWHRDLFRKSDFVEPEPPMVEHLMDLNKVSNIIPKIDGVDIEISERFSDEELTELTLRCFASTPEDLEIHGSDPSVTDPAIALRTTKGMRSGQYFPSPRECWQVATIDCEPVALVGSLLRESNIHPTVGVVGPVGVVPEQRRRGIARMLILSVIHTLKKLGCEYSVVGTFTLNAPALTLYKSLGYVDVKRLVLLRHHLS